VETAFRMEEKTDREHVFIAAMDNQIEIARQHRLIGGYVQTGPTAIRFVKGSRAYLSPQFGQNTVMIENLLIADTHGGKELLYKYQSEMFKYGGRPHWGLDLSITTGNNDFMTQLYDNFTEWKKVYDALNFSGSFNNRFTDRMGLSNQVYRNDGPPVV